MTCKQIYSIVTLVALATVFSSISAAAAGGDHGVGNGGLLDRTPYQSQSRHSDGGPESSAVGFDDVKSDWQNGTETNQAMLTGTWQLNNSISASRDCFRVRGPELYRNWNDHESVFNSYFQFFLLTDEYSPSRARFSVKIIYQDYAMWNQGPYYADPNEPQFQLWLWKEHTPDSVVDTPNHSGYLNYSCRGISGDPDRLLCAVTLKVEDPAGLTPEERACAQFPFAGFVGLGKVNSN